MMVKCLVGQFGTVRGGSKNCPGTVRRLSGCFRCFFQNVPKCPRRKDRTGQRKDRRPPRPKVSAAPVDSLGFAEKGQEHD